jgi:hypothetical protein
MNEIGNDEHFADSPRPRPGPKPEPVTTRACRGYTNDDDNDNDNFIRLCSTLRDCIQIHYPPEAARAGAGRTDPRTFLRNERVARGLHKVDECVAVLLTRFTAHQETMTRR